jgi:hypothetical protein
MPGGLVSRKALALVELDADGCLHVTAVELPESIDAFANVVKRARVRRDVTWFPAAHDFKLGLTRVTRVFDEGGAAVDVQPVGVGSPDFADAVRWLAGDGERPT